MFEISFKKSLITSITGQLSSCGQDSNLALILTTALIKNSFGQCVCIPTLELILQVFVSKFSKDTCRHVVFKAKQNTWVTPENTHLLCKGKYHCTADLLIICLLSVALLMLNYQHVDSFVQIQTSQTGGQPYSDTSP